MVFFIFGIISTKFYIELGRKWLIILCLSVFCGDAQSQLTANFSADSTRGCPPFLVQFTDKSTGNPTSFFWDLGNGTTSTQRNPGTIYFNPGTYTVKLIVKTASATDSIIKSQYIFVSSLPLPSFTVSGILGCAPYYVQFADQSSAGSGTITRYEWDFGDGSSSNLSSPDHIYNAAGNYTVTLRIINSNGCDEILTKSQLIKVNPSPVADFTSSSTASCNPPVVINFTNASTGNFTSSIWNFGDGNASNLTNPSNNYLTAGSYNVSLIVRNSFGCSDTVTRGTVIGSVSPDFAVPTTICQGAPAVFTNTSSGTVSSFWAFGDGTTSTQINPTKIFNQPGNFTVKLVNNFGACSDSISRQVVVTRKPVANFSFTAPTTGCAVPVSVSFNNSATGASSFAWYFGDGSTSSAANPSHTYTQLGAYTVSLVVKNNAGCSDSIAKADIIALAPPQIIGFDSLPYRGCAPHTQLFKANIISPEPIQSYFWNFGDGSTSNAISPAHTYSSPGFYSVTLRINTINGCKDTFTYRGAVVIGNRPQANFSASPKVSCAHDRIQFTDSSTGNVNVWIWQFGDGGSSGEQNPLYQYTDTGFFNVTLIVGEYFCYDTITLTNVVYIKPPVARFESRVSCDTPFTREFTNKSIGAVTSLWTFGDGATSTVKNPVHTYAAPGVYSVKLYVTNGACFDEITYVNYIIDEHPDFKNDSVACKNQPVVFTVNNINPANINYYQWDFGDGTPVEVVSVPVITKKYAVSGIYTTRLITIDLNNCQDTVIHPFNIKVLGPKAAFTNQEGACVNSPVAFTDRSIPYGNFAIVRWIWQWGDGQTDSLSAPPFIHTYTAPGRYDVRLIVIDAYGCRDTINKPDIIQITKPVAAFSVADSISCRNSNVAFINGSNGVNLVYAWTFGDGGTSNTSNPTYAYPAFGNYTVGLTITDRYGCRDSISRLNFITVANATAAFTMSDSVINCPPVQIGFFNQSNFFTSSAWTFGDGSFSNLDNPSHFFRTARNFNVKLVVKGYGNCTDSITKLIIVKGPSGTFNYSPKLMCVNDTVSFVALAQNNNYLTWDFGDGSTLTTTQTNVAHVYATQGKYVPKILLQDTSLNCVVPVIGDDTIFVTGALAHIRSIKPLFCDSATLRFFDSSIVQYDTIANYVWTFGDGSNSNIKNPTHSYPVPGLYTISLNVSTNGGCSDSASIVLRVVASPKPVISGNDSVCLYSPLTVTGSLAQVDTSQIIWSWNMGNGNSYLQQQPPTQVYNDAGIKVIRLVATNSSGCLDSVNFPVTVLPLPGIFAGKDTIICRGQAATLSPTGGVNYNWQANTSLSCTLCAQPLASPLSGPASYVVAGTDVYGCTNTDTVIVQVVQPFSISVSQPTSICRGQTVRLLATGTQRYEWLPVIGLDDPFSNNPGAGPDTTTTYQVIGVDSNNCFRDTGFVKVEVYPIPSFNIIPDAISIAAGNSVTINTTNSADITGWLWNPSAGLSCFNCAQPIATPVSSVTYTAVVKNAGGCTAQDKVTIEILCGEGNLYVPNTFSPNNDGMNDVFYPRGKGIAGIRLFRIFNRWGALVFEKTNFAANDPSAGWNGMFKNQPLSSDVFVYQLEVICANGQFFNFKGNITLVK